MRSTILSLVVGLGVLSFSLAAPTQAKADEHRGPTYTGKGDTQLVYWRGGYGGRAFYPGWGGYGRFYGGYGYYPYRSYYPRYYGGYYPYGYGYGVRPYYNYYSRPGFFW